MIKGLWGRITGKDAKKQFPQQQASVLGRVGDYVVIFPYGYYADLPEDALLRMIEPGVAISATVGRPDDTGRGEPVFFHPSTNTRVILRNDGNLEINMADQQKMIVNGDLEVNGDADFYGSVKANDKVIDDTHGHEIGRAHV